MADQIATRWRVTQCVATWLAISHTIEPSMASNRAEILSRVINTERVSTWAVEITGERALRIKERIKSRGINLIRSRLWSLCVRCVTKASEKSDFSILIFSSLRFSSPLFGSLQFAWRRCNRHIKARCQMVLHSANNTVRLTRCELNER